MKNYQPFLTTLPYSQLDCQLKNKKPCKSVVYKVLSGVEGITIEHLIPVLMFLDNLGK